MRAILELLDGAGGGDPAFARSLRDPGRQRIGKTTSIAKLAHRFRAGALVILGAGDTFRAAADQLRLGGAQRRRHRASHKDNADPAAVAFDTCAAALAREKDVVIVDTAGRLHTQANLMRELEKVRGVLGKKIDGAPHETWLVIDGTNGQNAIRQAKEFTAAVDVTGLIVAADGTAAAARSSASSASWACRSATWDRRSAELAEVFEPEAFVDAIVSKTVGGGRLSGATGRPPLRPRRCGSAKLAPPMAQDHPDRARDRARGAVVLARITPQHRRGRAPRARLHAADRDSQGMVVGEPERSDLHGVFPQRHALRPALERVEDEPLLPIAVARRDLEDGPRAAASEPEPRLTLHARPGLLDPLPPEIQVPGEGFTRDQWHVGPRDLTAPLPLDPPVAHVEQERQHEQHEARGEQREESEGGHRLMMRGPASTTAGNPVLMRKVAAPRPGNHGRAAILSARTRGVCRSRASLATSRSPIMAFRSSPLSFSHDALEPYINKRTMELHHGLHHAAYVNKFSAVEGTALASKSAEEIIQNLDAVPENIPPPCATTAWLRQPLDLLVDHGLGRAATHRQLGDAINGTFGSFDNFKEKFNGAGGGQFGSGWVWLVMTKEGKLDVVATPNQDTPMSDGHHVIMGNDVWEHAYYLTYENRRPEYLKAWWNVVDFDAVAARAASAV